MGCSPVIATGFADDAAFLNRRTGDDDVLHGRAEAQGPRREQEVEDESGVDCRDLPLFACLLANK